MKYKSLFDMWNKSCAEFGGSVLFSDNKASSVIAYKDAFRQICFLAGKLKSLGVKRFDNISLFAVNAPEWLILEQAVITLGAVCVSKSSEINVSELQYVFINSGSCALITDNYELIKNFSENIEGFFDKVKFVLYTGAQTELIHPKMLLLKDIMRELKEDTVINADFEENPDDTAYINYTSGTSSSPKGAMLPNIGMSYVIEELQKFNDIKPGKTFIATFPLSSAGGKSFNLLCLSRGCRIIYTPYKEFYETIKKYEPDYLHLAPKIIQTMHSMFMEAVKNKGCFFEKCFNAAYKISEKILYFERNCLYKGKFLYTETALNAVKNLFDKLIYKQIRNVLFKDDITLFIGSAHLAKPLEDFLQIMNISHVQHYGLTETTGLDVSNTIESQKRHPYTTGVPFSKTVLKIVNPETGEPVQAGETGLIMLKGPEILKGYYKNEEASNKALTSEHFLNTGDLGYLDKEGYLTVLSRYDDVIVMSNGYNVYTPLLENEMKDSEYVIQAVIAGHGKPYLTSLIVLNLKEYEKWSRENALSCNTEPNKDEKFKEFLIEHLNEKIKRKNQHKYYEKIKKVYFLKEEFTAENGMLTGTLKLKYRRIINKYQDIIDGLYDEKKNK